MPGDNPPFGGQGRWNGTQMDPGSPRSGGQRDRGCTRERSCTGARRTSEFFQSVHLPRRCKLRREAEIEWDRAWALENTGRPTKRLIDVPTKKKLAYWFGLRKATTAIHDQTMYFPCPTRRSVGQGKTALGSRSPEGIYLTDRESPPRDHANAPKALPKCPSQVCQLNL
jgi:hypothetical protein